ncbi:Origin of replication complex subunit 6 [Lamellibrachia satsuma]|nr:Origin of replication complex subunit 6 [Lamellibrachia satsuma]
MERHILSSAAQKFGIDSEPKILRKAEELMRLLDLRLGCSSLDTLSLSGACKAVLCLELAADGYGQPISKSDAVKASGMNKKMYQSAMQAARCLLDLQSQVTIPDLTVQLGCPAVRPLALQVLNRYQSDRQNENCATTVFSQVLFNTVAVYAACRKHHIKCNKTKMVEIAGSTSAVFNSLLVQMEKCAETIMSEGKEQKSQKTQCFMDEIEALEEDISNEGNVGNMLSCGELPTEPYKDWRERILQQAYTALGRQRPGHSPGKRAHTKPSHK